MAALTAYVAGLITTPAAFLGVFGGMWWWRRLRRAQGHTEPMLLELKPVPEHPSPTSLQDAPVLGRMSMRNVPGNRRTVRGRRPR